MSTPKDSDENKTEGRGVVPPWQRGETSASTGLTAGDVAKAAGGSSVPQINAPGGGPQSGAPASGKQSGGGAQGSGAGGAKSGGASGPQPGRVGPAPRGVVSGDGGPKGSPAGGQGSSAPQAQPGSPAAATRKIPGAGPATPGGPNGPGAGSGAPGSPGGARGASATGKPGTAPGQSGAVGGAAQRSPVAGKSVPPAPSGPGTPNKPGGAPAATGPKVGARPAAGVAAGRPAESAAADEVFTESETKHIKKESLPSADELPDLDSIHHVEPVKPAAARGEVRAIPARTVGNPLRAAVQIRRVDPWSVFKIAGVLSIAGFFIWMIAVAILYGVFEGMGFWDQINSSISDFGGDSASSTADVISAGNVFLFSAGFGVAAAIIVTAIATISAYIYNICADTVGGIEITLADLD